MGGDGRIAEVFSAVHFIEKDLGAIRVTKKFQIFACKAQKDRGAFNIAVLCFFLKCIKSPVNPNRTGLI